MPVRDCCLKESVFAVSRICAVSGSLPLPPPRPDLHDYAHRAREPLQSTLAFTIFLRAIVLGKFCPGSHLARGIR
jgi:hypothetical protein